MSKRLFIAPASILAPALTLALGSSPYPAHAATLTVCKGGCDFTAIQEAIDAASEGDDIAIGPGTFVENLVIDRSDLTLIGAGQEATTILPSFSEPAPCADSSLCDGAASTLVLVRADRVTLSGFTLDGDNPALESGVVRGGADLDARNGIVTDYLAGDFEDLVVHDVTVRNVYLRGIYAARASFDIQRNTIENVRGDGLSIGLFTFAGRGIFAENRVSDTNDAISANHSAGVQFLDNTITRSASGIHTDNAGDGGGVNDLIEGNSVTDCLEDGYGAWIFLPYLPPTVQGNTIERCAIGLAVFGGANLEPARFVGNRVTGDNAPGGAGILATTDQRGYGCGDLLATFSANTISRHEVGVLLEQPGCAFSATLSYNNLFRNGVGLHNATERDVDATYNWWGCPRGPGARFCGEVIDTGAGVTTWMPFLRVPVRGMRAMARGVR